MEEIIVKPRDYMAWKLSDGKVYSISTMRKGFKKITTENPIIDLTTLIKYDHYESNGMLALTFKNEDGEEKTNYLYCESQKTNAILAYINRYLPTDYKEQTVFYKRCRACGHVLTYTKEDIENNIRSSNKEADARSSVLTDTVFGNKAGAAHAEAMAQTYRENQKDLNHCPDCGSEDLEKIEKE